MTYTATTTLKAIRAALPCHDGWTKLLATLGKTKADDEPLPLLTVLDSNGLDDALWVLSNTECAPRLARHFQAWCAAQVLHIFEAEYPNDTRVRDQIAMLRNDDATDAERAAARAAWAAWAAGGEAAWAAAGAAAWAAAGEAAWAAAGEAARDAQEKQLRAMLEGAQ